MSPAAFAGESSFIDRDRQPDWNGYNAFCQENAGWLDDYALYMAVREARKGAPWQEWPENERDRTDLEALKARYAAAMEGYRRDQYWFWSQWEQLKDYANSQGVRIVGDLPLGVAAGLGGCVGPPGAVPDGQPGLAQPDGGRSPRLLLPRRDRTGAVRCTTGMQQRAAATDGGSTGWATP